MEKLVGALAPDDKGDQELTENEGALSSVADIWSGIKPVSIYFSDEVESCGDRKGLLYWDQRLLQIFGRGPYWFRIFGLGSTSVEDVDAPYWSFGEDITCGYVWSR